MMRSLFSGVAGLKSHQTRMDSIGNNIANVNTTGYKSTRVTFADTLYQTTASASAPTEGVVGGTNPKQIGLGTGVASIDTIFTDGSTQATGKNTDLAISGSGLFVVKNNQGTYYTRDGAFEFDADGNYVLPGSGLYVEGWTAKDGALTTTGAIGRIQIQSGKSMASKATATVTYSNNLNSDEATISTIKITDSKGATITVPATSTSSYKIGDSVSKTIASEDITFSDGSTVSGAANSYTMATKYVPTAMNGTLADGTSLVISMTSTESYKNGSAPSSKVKSLNATLANGDTLAVGSSSTVTYTNGSVPSGVTVASISGSQVTLSDGSIITAATPTAYTLGSAVPSALKTMTGTLVDGTTFTAGTATSATMGSALSSTISSMSGTVNGGDTFTAGSGAIVPATGLTVSGIKLTTTDGDTIDVASSDTGSYKKGGTYGSASDTIAALSVTDSEGKITSVTSGTTGYTLGQSSPLSTTATVYDSLGNAHSVPITVTKTAANTWNVALAATSIKESNGTTTTLSMNDATLKFTSSGAYDSGSATLKLTYGNGAAAQSVAISLSSVTQYSGGNTIKTDTDGHAAGTLKSIAVDSSGIITGTYTNGVKQSEAQVAIAQFNNPGGLTKSGTSLYTVSNNSGSANVKTASDLGVTITPSALEMSNVDIANEFSDMIVTQRGFQSNSKIITVGDEMLETLINMKR